MTSSRLPGRVGRKRRSSSTVAPTISGAATLTPSVVAPSTVVTLTDPGAAGTTPLYFTLDGADHALFQINPVTGVVSFKHASTAGVYHINRHVKNIKGKVTQAITVTTSAPAYVASAVHFNGDARLSIASLAVPGSKRQFLGSWWLRVASLADNGYGVVWVADPAGRYDPLSALETDPLDQNLTYYDCSQPPSQAKIYTQPSGVVVAATWLNILIAVDSNHAEGAKVIQMYVNDVSNNQAPLDSDVAYDMWVNALPFFFGDDGGGSFLKADVADAWIAPGQFLDLSIEANRRKFISADGKPVDLGSDGTTPTGVAPAVFFRGNAAAFPTNRGAGGAFTLTGAITNASTSPSD